MPLALAAFTALRGTSGGDASAAAQPPPPPHDGRVGVAASTSPSLGVYSDVGAALIDHYEQVGAVAATYSRMAGAGGSGAEGTADTAWLNRPRYAAVGEGLNHHYEQVVAVATAGAGGSGAGGTAADTAWLHRPRYAAVGEPLSDAAGSGAYDHIAMPLYEANDAQSRK